MIVHDTKGPVLAVWEALDPRVLGMTVQDHVSLAHALVGHAMTRVSAQDGLNAALVTAECMEIRDRLEACGADPDPTLGEREAAARTVLQLLDDALDALEQVPVADLPAFIQAVWPMVAGVQVRLLDDEELLRRLEEEVEGGYIR